MRKRLIVRCDDVGYTEIYDLGIYKAIEEGVVTAADVMLDSPHTVEALKWLKERPWISIGWHPHFWESPVLPGKEVPSLIDEEGRFKWRHNHNELRAEATYEDSDRELRAELDRTKEIYGKYPVVASVREDGTDFKKAMKKVCEEYGVDYRFWEEKVTQVGKKKVMKFGYHTVQQKKDDYGLDKFDSFDPSAKLQELKWESEDDILMVVGHPGYCDEHILAESSFTIHRIRELQMMISDEFKQIIIDNGIELINVNDAIYGTNDYQDHLKKIDSPLWIGNIERSKHE